MTRTVLAVLGVVAIALGVVAYSSLFTVYQTEQALVLQFGDPKRVITTPGLHVKLPFIQNVVEFEKRLLDFDAPPEEVILADQKRLIVDSYARFRIVDPLKFYQTVGFDERVFRGRLGTFMSSGMRRVLGSVGLVSVLSQERVAIMEEIRKLVSREAAAFGVEVADVRIRRADLPEENTQAILSRMQTERERVAREIRAQGAEIAQRIRASAERERTVIIAEAQRESQITRGQGEQQAFTIYAEAYSRDPDFYAFTRSMQAYRESLANDSTTLVLSPDSDFFRFFTDLEGRARGAAR
ncbi:MAG: protease modulator HflC [Proteobacteria bacterium]|nr:protease modulator HflC [Pseudomonadota bacterium]